MEVNKIIENEYKKQHIKSQQEIVHYLREVKREKINKMIEREYKKRHIKLWQEIVDYLHEVKRGNVKIHYKSIADLKSAILNTQYEGYGVVFTGVFQECHACDFALIENGSILDMCVKCPLINKLGCDCTDEYSGSYALLIKAYTSQDYEKAIRLAIKIRDAWREVK